MGTGRLDRLSRATARVLPRRALAGILGAGMDVPCTTATGDDGFCVRTTGSAGYCLFSGRCTTPACRKDADCREVCGPHAACIVCEGDCHSGPTVCVGPSDGSCVQA